MSTQQHDVVAEGDAVIVIENHGKATAKRSHFLDTSVRATLKLGRGSGDAKILIGAPFSSALIADGKIIHRTSQNPELELYAQDAEVDEITGDNRNLVQDNTSQKLTSDEIREMKEKGMSGAEIVNALVENSKTFAGKTQFSQKKYIAKKKSKFYAYARIERANAANVCQHYFTTKPDKICQIRPDALSRIILSADIREGDTCLIVEQGMGIVTAAVQSILNGSGHIIHAHLASQPRLDIARLMRLENLRENLISCPLAELANLSTKSDEELQAIDIPAKTQREKRQQLPYTPMSPIETIRRLKENDLADSLIIACESGSTQVVKSCLGLLRLGQSFVIYCPAQQPLVDCMNALSKSGEGANMSLADSWFREYQVLPGRTHPINSMSASSGFLLTGVRVEAYSQADSVPQIQNKSSAPQAANNGESETKAPNEEEGTGGANKRRIEDDSNDDEEHSKKRAKTEPQNDKQE
eukprot:c18302_g1_i2.p1 GENE.c18302_g1_i2~~c18302_g1_i2.p1  ORF type:complete len:470 (+),score=123.61 c18302_g1_i2:34-1443(+)